ncbi:hypothetical protein MUK42_07615 [Musa troglodytarum]|uniref:Uncharacterized protein n=1 Tax=Musa troglodytarum TaxID=320322 RepID=A0A9E7EED8_9LILI|nr:hypothetical protein MUK42_07615 [Musa troglodytarum]
MKLILAKCNSHFVYGCLVLVEPYKEKGKRSPTSVGSSNHCRIRGVTSWLVNWRQRQEKNNWYQHCSCMLSWVVGGFAKRGAKENRVSVRYSK